MIIILSDAHDSHADIVEQKLLTAGQIFFRLNLDTISLLTTHLTFDGSKWIIKKNDKTISSEDISAIWLRRGFVELLLDEKESQDVNFLIWKNEWNKVLLGFYMGIQSVPWLSPIKTSFRAENKFFQLQMAKKVGLTMPQQIVSNDKLKLLDFATNNNNEIVLKLMSQEFYKINDEYQGIYVNKVSSQKLNDFMEAGENPITLQQYIDKQYEVRYTVVGKEHFACRIDSQDSNRTKIDWRRYDIANTPHYSIEPPDDIHQKVDALLDELEINFGAIDFIVDHENEWWFLEINPLGQWLWIEDLTGMDISGSITRWLCENKST